MAERIKLTPEMLAVWRGIQQGKTNTEIAAEQGRTRTWTNSVLGKLADYGLVRHAGDLSSGAEVSRNYPWYAVADVPILPPGATLHVEYVPETQRDHRVRPVTRVSWPPWDIQGVPYLREDGQRPKDALPERALVVVTNLETGGEWEFRASIRQSWAESDTKERLTDIGPHLTFGKTIGTAMTLNIACVLGVKAALDITGKDRIDG